jgi:hypothetical protein
MDTLNIIFGIIGIVSLLFSIFTYYKAESKKAIEASKAAAQKEMIRNVSYSIAGILHSIDAIVQAPKTRSVTIAQLQDMARVARGQTYLLANQIKIEKDRLENWRYGELVKTETSSSPHSFE